MSTAQFTDTTPLAADQPQFLRLEEIEVDKLFGIYDHRIRLKLFEHATLLHGPNGVGKTVVLRMIDALIKGHLSYFRTIPFSRFRVSFDNGSAIEIRNDAESSDEHESTIELYTEGQTESAKVSLQTRAEQIAEQVAETISWLHPHPTIPAIWVDIRDGELMSPSDILSRYRDSTAAQTIEASGNEELDWYQDFLKRASTHLIEAQRLFQIGQMATSRSRYWRDDSAAMVSTVLEYCDDFRARLGQAMADYGRRSQTLDQSFPRRLITAGESLSKSILETRIADLEQTTAELKRLGILEETQVDPPFHAGTLDNIDPTQAKVMTLYVTDTAKKLQTLDDLSVRCRLLLDNVNHKYRHKKVMLDTERGLVAESDSGRSLSLDLLSSGEQHELVLHYALLFKVPSNTVVLIDEPELSLHVAWQRRFLSDLLEIVKVSKFDALIATHSPYIIGDREDLMVGLQG